MNNPITASVLDEVLSERIEQDQQWGGPAHDDQQPVQDVLMLIEAKLGKACQVRSALRFRVRDGETVVVSTVMIITPRVSL